MPKLDVARIHPTVQTLAGTIATIVAVIGLFVLTDAVGRVQRNETWLFAVALFLVVIGTSILIGVGIWLGTKPTPTVQADASKPIVDDAADSSSIDGTDVSDNPSSIDRPDVTDEVASNQPEDGWVVVQSSSMDSSTQASETDTAIGSQDAELPARNWIVITGLIVVTVGMCLAACAAILSGAATERPIATLTYDPDEALPLRAHVHVTNLASDKRVVFMVDGLSPDPSNPDHWKPHTIYQAYVGPNSQGVVDQSADLALPRSKQFLAVGVKAYTGSQGTEFDDTPCADYPRHVATKNQAKRLLKLGPGCVIMELPDEASSTALSNNTRGR